MLNLNELDEKESIKEEDHFQDINGVSLNIAFIGIGHGGSRIVKGFYEYGYRRVIVYNTSQKDLDKIDMPDIYKQKIGDKTIEGSGKSMSRSFQTFNSDSDVIFNKLTEVIDKDIDRVMICATTGGGAGSGGLIPIYRSVLNFMETTTDYEKDEIYKRIGFITTIPKHNELKNGVILDSVKLLLSKISELTDKGECSPVIIIDNEHKSNDLPKGIGITKYWEYMNRETVALFSTFISIPDEDGFENFDQADLDALLSSGNLLVDRFSIKSEYVFKMNRPEIELVNKFDESLATNKTNQYYKIDEGEKNPDLKTALIIISDEKLLDEKEGLSDAFERLKTKLTMNNSRLFTGIYSVPNDKDKDNNKLTILLLRGGYNHLFKNIHKLN